MALSGYGLIGTGVGYRDEAMQGLAEASKDETDRDIQNKNIEAQAKASKQQLGATVGGLAGAYAGASYGAEYGSYGGPIGTGIGAIVGAIAGGLLSSKL